MYRGRDASTRLTSATEMYSFVYDITHLAMFTSKPSRRALSSFHVAKKQQIYLKTATSRARRREFICNWHEQASNYWNFNSTRWLKKKSQSVSGEERKKKLPRFLKILCGKSIHSQRKEKQLKTIFFNGFSIPLNVLSKLFQFLFGNGE